ncbi:hypothetical protein YIM_29380 [Amycolatopsis sp. YIM 10]|nr:hypothetical protein YIM_29380 [Amycolatopsis sp. YIM 10]
MMVDRGHRLVIIKRWPSRVRDRHAAEITASR